MHRDLKSDNAYYERLADRLLKGTITPEEKRELEQWYMHSPSADAKVPRDYAESEQAHEQVLLKKIRGQINKKEKEISLRRRVILWSSAAAAILLFCLMGTWALKKTTVVAPEQEIAQLSDVAPGRDGAVLKLSNGELVVLDSLKEGMVVRQGDVQLVKENGQLKYIGASDRIVYNDIVTDRGRQWKMVLPDGTKVWLNAASSLHYPISFKGQKERVVELTGEAYFEVAHNAAQPFKVRAGNRVIQDIGTAFNVNAYSDEPGVVTTLVEGIVKVDGVQLKPGQQATVTEGGEINIKAVNTKDFTAWVSGQLSLDNVTVKQLMLQLSRWYDVDVVYKGAVPDIRLGGLIDRNVYLSDIISVLNAYGVHLKLTGKTLVITSH